MSGRQRGIMNRMHHTLSDRTTHVASALARRDEHAADYNLAREKIEKFLFFCGLNNRNSTNGSLFFTCTLHDLVCFLSLLGKDDCIIFFYQWTQTAKNCCPSRGEIEQENPLKPGFCLTVPLDNNLFITEMNGRPHTSSHLTISAEAPRPMTHCLFWNRFLLNVTTLSCRWFTHQVWHSPTIVLLKGMKENSKASRAFEFPAFSFSECL